MPDLTDHFPLFLEALGLALLHSLWQGLLIGVLFRTVLSFMAEAGPGPRYWTAVTALALLALSVPLTTLYLLDQSLPVTTAPVAAASAGPAMNALASVHSGNARLLGLIDLGQLVEWTVLLWLAGVTVVSIRTLAAWRRLDSLRRAADMHGAASLDPLVARLRLLFGLRRRVAIGLSASIASPMVIGWLKPLILLPPALAARLPQQHLEMIIAHELAHLRRNDHWINLFQVATETLMFYHPVVAMVSHRIRIERESACDDLAVSATRRRLDYVEMLAALEKQRHAGPAIALGIHDGQMLARIQRLVERNEPGKARGAVIPALIAAVAMIALAISPLIDDPPSVPEAATDLQPSSGQSIASLDGGAAAPMPEPDPPAKTPLNDGPRSAFQSEPDAEAPSRPRGVAQRSPYEIGKSAHARNDSNPTNNLARSPAVVGPVTTADAGPPAGDTQSRPGTNQDRMDSRSADPGPFSERQDSEQRVSETQVPEPAPPAVADTSVEMPVAGDGAAQPTIVSSGTPDIEPRTPEADLTGSATLLAANINAPASRPLPEMSSPLAAAEASVGDRAGDPARITLAGGELLREIPPSYPRRALRREISGSVELAMKIDRTGRVVDTEIVTETPLNAGFGAAAATAATQWKFEPFTRNGDPVTQRKTVVFDFEPGNGCPIPTGTRLPSC